MAQAKRRTIYILPPMEWWRLHRRAYFAQQQGHREVCGVVFVDSRGRLAVRFLANRRNLPYTHRILEKDATSAASVAKRKGQRLLGTFHSHPLGEARPGKADLESGFLNGFELIYDVCDRTARLWQVHRTCGKLTVKELKTAMM
jgi:proteasome lid subunit RPN8/RPN11